MQVPKRKKRDWRRGTLTGVKKTEISGTRPQREKTRRRCILAVREWREPGVPSEISLAALVLLLLGSATTGEAGRSSKNKQPE